MDWETAKLFLVLNLPENTEAQDPSVWPRTHWSDQISMQHQCVKMHVCVNRAYVNCDMTKLTFANGNWLDFIISEIKHRCKNMCQYKRWANNHQLVTASFFFFVMFMCGSLILDTGLKLVHLLNKLIPAPLTHRLLTVSMSTHTVGTLLLQCWWNL